MSGFSRKFDAALPEPSYTNSKFDDPDAYQAAVRGGDRLYALLGAGTFSANLELFQIAGFAIQRGIESLARVAATSLRPNQAAIIVWPDGGPLPIIRGIQVVHGDLAFLHSGMESYHRTTGPNKFIAVTFELDVLKRGVAELTGIELPYNVGPIIRPPDYLRVRLGSKLKAVLYSARRWPDILVSPNSVDAISEVLLRTIIRCVSYGQVSHEGVHRRQRALSAKEFEAVVEANLHGTPSIPELCQMISVSGRTLRSICQEHLGMSPHRFLSMQRLHRIRSHLIASRSTAATVTSVATNCGVWELGRFAVAYKTLFGESPSVTLRRAQEI